MAEGSTTDTSYAPKVLRSVTGDRDAWYSCTGPDQACVLVIYTGGTIGMVKDEKGLLKPAPGILDKRLREFPELHDEEYMRSQFGDCENCPLVLPPTGDPRRVMYSISEYSVLIDSSNITVNDWTKIAIDIKDNYDSYDGFVILHGTDTMAYTSSALSFLLESLGKSVIVTGAQIPVFETRSDGRDNLLNALILAGNYVIPEVTLMFHGQLFRGNRVSKFSISHLDAFASFNMAPLATIGINVEINWDLILPPPEGTLYVHTVLNRDVGILRLFPSITVELVEAFFGTPMKGVVLQTYGAGNVPTKRKDIMHAIRRATERGVLIVSCSQCLNGAVDPAYETGRELLNVGAIPGADMTPEAALTKLSFVISKTEWTDKKKREKLQESLRGELTTDSERRFNLHYNAANISPWKRLLIH
ncbi:L-asparaginase 1-like [Dermacentor albipictus]|uniref:L-asparaginase 1-like n=1 Tax=Dermacentor albipictus TaxID=60249 RepID=UPI0031FCC3A8